MAVQSRATQTGSSNMRGQVRGLICTITILCIYLCALEVRSVTSESRTGTLIESGASLATIEQRESGDHGTGSSPLERFVDEQVNQLAGESDANCPVQKYVDQLAIRLSEAVSSGQYSALIMSELAQAIDLADLIKPTSEKEESSSEMTEAQAEAKRLRHKKFAAGPGARLLLEGGNERPPTPLIVHADRRLSESAMRELLQFANRAPLVSQRMLLMNMFKTNQQLYDEAHPTSTTSKRSMWLWLDKTVESGESLIDHLHFAAGFLEQLPVIGDGVRELKRKGQNIFSIIQTVRSLKGLLERSKAAVSGAAQFARTGRGKKILTKAGLHSLRRLAFAMIHYFGADKISLDQVADRVREIVGRCGYYLLINVALKAPGLSD